MNRLYFIRIARNSYDYEDFVYAPSKEGAAMYFHGKINRRLESEGIDDWWNSWEDLMEYIEESE